MTTEGEFWRRIVFHVAPVSRAVRARGLHHDGNTAFARRRSLGLTVVKNFGTYPDMEEHEPSSEAPTVDGLIDALGAEEIRGRAGLSRSAPINWRSAGKFPSALYLLISEMCREKGLPPPPLGLFAWRPTVAAEETHKARSPQIEV